MAYLQDTPSTFCGLDQFYTACKRMGHWLFEQHMITRFECGDGGGYVHLVLGGDNGGIAKLAARQECFPRGKALLFVQIVVVGKVLATNGIGFSNAHKAYLFWVL
jgi:hypothetical protein